MRRFAAVTVHATQAMLGTAALLTIAAGPVWAHPGIVPGELAPGTTLDAQVILAHGCGPEGAMPASEDETSPTRAVTLHVPERLGVTPLDTQGWSLTSEQDHSGRTTSARWELVDAAGTFEPVFLDVNLDATELDGPEDLWIPIVQDCVGGGRMHWTVDGMQPRAGAMPAMSLSVTPDAANAPTFAGRFPVGLVVLVLVAASGAGALSFALTNRRG